MIKEKVQFMMELSSVFNRIHFLLELKNASGDDRIIMLEYITQQKHQVENFVNNTAAFSTRISKISRENNVERCTLSRFFAFLINAAVL